MNKRLALLGAGGHARVVADMAEAIGWQSIHFFADGGGAAGRIILEGNSGDLLSRLSEFDGVFVAIGDNSNRIRTSTLLRDAGANIINIVHPFSSVSRHASLGKGVAVMAGSVINADACIGDFTIINTGATVDHDCSLGEGVHVSPGAHLAGKVSVGNSSWVGIGACVRQSINIGERVIVGAGAVVVRDVHDDMTVVGNPAVPVNK